MSHFTTIQTQIKDIEALKSARQEVGLPVVEKAQARSRKNQNTTSPFRTFTVKRLSLRNFDGFAVAFVH
jgi:hypothetical protein